MIYLFSFLIGIVAGMRTMTAPTAVSWAARFGVIDLGDSWLAFLNLPWTPWILTVLAVGELVTDQLPSTPSRKVPVQFGARIVSGMLSGAAIGLSGSFVIGGLLGGAGAVVGTLGGAALRSRLASAFGKDRPAALLEDALAIGGAVIIVLMLR